MSQRVATVRQDPQENLAYRINWAPQLEGATVADSSWTNEGLTHTGNGSIDTPATSTVSPLVKGGTPGTNYYLENTIVTSTGETLQGHILVRVR